MAIKVSVSFVPVINFSMQQNHVPVIREIILKNDGEEELTDLSISLESDPAFAEPTTLHVGAIAPGSEVRLTTIPVRISATYLSNLTERVEGHIKVTVKSNEEILFSESYEIAVLAFDQWGGIAVLPEMLAAFVTPNQPEIMAIVKRASEILGSWTDSSAMDEYQTRDPNRVKKQMAAIYEAIAERKIAYCSVPASFEEYGQRIR
ncbi:MAG: DNA helicase, partial [Muribaculaceae bacterium]|nr:DNA helicase [Muribaculaceae bacterium]